MNSGEDPCYIFAYGSLIWRPDFVYSQLVQARANGYERRFWQASHDHRGTPSMPGRVLTLVSIPGGRCDGMLYQVPDERCEATLLMLDEREQDGYERTLIDVIPSGSTEPVSALTWLAGEDNPSWIGEQPLSELATLIASRQGPSGTNKDYLLRLQAAFTQLGIKDRHIEALVHEIEQMPNLD